MANVCAACNTTLDPGASFCTNCGISAAAPANPAFAASPGPSAAAAAAAAPAPAPGIWAGYGAAYAANRGAPVVFVAPAAYPMLRVARVVCRIASIMTLLAGVGWLVMAMRVGSSPIMGQANGLGAVGGGLAALGVLILIAACLYAAMLWAAGDLITIALRLEPTLPPEGAVSGERRQ